MSLYNSQELHDVMTQIDQQLLRYFTACENEQHHLNVVEDAITGVLVPRVEELLAEDNMNGRRAFHVPEKKSGADGAVL